MWTSGPYANDQYCTGGQNSGELCGWVVTVANSDVTTDGGLARNVATGTRSSSTCLQGGDSGSPVYTQRFSDSTVAGKGITGSASGNNPCRMLFTAIHRTQLTWPGLGLLTN